MNRSARRSLRRARRRASIAWSDVGAVDEVGFPKSIQISSKDGRRRIRVHPTLEHLPQFVEMLAAQLRRVTPVDGQASAPPGAN